MRLPDHLVSGHPMGLPASSVQDCGLRTLRLRWMGACIQRVERHPRNEIQRLSSSLVSNLGKLYS